MHSESLQALKRPVSASSKERLEKAGLSLEYFKNFEQAQHDFHSHDFIEILYVFNGTFRHITAGQTYDECAGGLTILNFRQFHSLKTPEGPVELMNIYINPERFNLPDLPDSILEKLYELIPLHPGLENRLNGIIHLNVSDVEKMKSILNMLLLEQESDEWGNEAASLAILRLFLIELCRAAPIVKNEQWDSYKTRMEAVRIYLEKHYTEAVSLNALCRLSGLKPANLCRRFKDYSGMSTGDFLKQKRLAAALHKLRTSDDKILVIAEDCGFSDVSRFNRFFRTAFSCSPSQYRNNLKTN
jgi:AraC-like DNA-binding protein/quercetin dioxygenase-like cupin family protein